MFIIHSFKIDFFFRDFKPTNIQTVMYRHCQTAQKNRIHKTFNSYVYTLLNSDSSKEWNPFKRFPN